MASRGMSLKNPAPLPSLPSPPLPSPPAAAYRFSLAVLQVAAALGFCRSWVKTRNKTNTHKNARLALRAGFNTVYIAPVNGVEMFTTLGHRY